MKSVKIMNTKGKILDTRIWGRTLSPDNVQYVQSLKVECAESLCGNCVNDSAQERFLRSAGLRGEIVFQLPYWAMEASEGNSRHILTYRCKIEGE